MEFPVELDVDSVTINKVGGGWDIIFHLKSGDTVSHWTEYPDNLYDGLIEAGEIEP